MLRKFDSAGAGQSATFQRRRTNYFVCECDYEQIAHVLRLVAPKCKACDTSLMHVCLESSCALDSLFCWDCGRLDHLLHRTNELPLLFVCPTVLQTRRSSTRQFLGDVQRKLEAQNSREPLRVQLLSTCSSLFENEFCQNGCIEQLQQIVEHVINLRKQWNIRSELFEEQVERLKNLREQFSQCSKRLLLRDDKVILQRLINCFDAEDQTQVHVKEAILQLLNWRTNRDLTSFLMESRMNAFVTTVWGPLALHISSHRSAELSIEELEYFRPRRLKIAQPSGKPSPANLESLCRELNSVVEVTFRTGSMPIIPYSVVSLSINFEDDARLPSLPSTLKKLVADVHFPRYQFQREVRLFQQLQNLPQLRYLTVRNQHLAGRPLLDLVRLGIRKQLRMLVLLERPDVWRLRLNTDRLESQSSHYQQPLHVCYETYIRTMSQAVVLLRTRYLRHNYFMEHVLDYALECAAELDVRSFKASWY